MQIDILCEDASLADKINKDIEYSLANLGALAHTRKICDSDKMMEMGIVGKSAILINGKLEIYNKTPKIDEIENVIKKYM